MGTGGSFPGSEAADVKNTQNYTSTPPHVFMVWCLVKYRVNFTLHGVVLS
jgi:hypothetical protein